MKNAQGFFVPIWTVKSSTFSYEAICAGFDSVYVSFYKGLGAIAGACLVGEDDLVERAREWRHRHGGMLFALWPYAASALAGLRARLDRMPAYLAHARAIATSILVGGSLARRPESLPKNI